MHTLIGQQAVIAATFAPIHGGMGEGFQQRHPEGTQNQGGAYAMDESMHSQNGDAGHAFFPLPLRNGSRLEQDIRNQVPDQKRQEKSDRGMKHAVPKNKVCKDT